MKLDYSKTINEQLEVFDYYKNNYLSYQLEIENLKLDLESIKTFYGKAKELVKEQQEEITRLNNRIDKAIEYIESECNEFYVNEPHYRGYQIINIEPLIDILKGSDNNDK